MNFLKTLIYGKIEPHQRLTPEHEECPICTLPKEVIITEIIRELPIKDIKRLARSNTYFWSLCIDDNVWVHKIHILNTNRANMKIEFKSPYYKLYQDLLKWQWDETITARTKLIITNNGLIVSRLNKADKITNPAIRTYQQLTPENNRYKVKILKRGTWLGIGICDNKFRMENGSTLGRQKHCINSAIFCQDSTLLQAEGCYSEKTLPHKLMAGDYITVIVHFDTNSISYLQNGAHKGSLLIDNLSTSGPIYPCVNLSHKTEIQLLLEDQHEMNTGDV